MNRVRSLGLPATSKARIVKFLFSVGLHGAEVGGMSASHMNDVRISARKSLGKGANLRRSSPLELMAYGGPAGDPQVTIDLNTVRAWQRKLNAGTLDWPLEPSAWEHALDKGRGRGPIRHLRLLADRLGWKPLPGGWLSEEQYFTWSEADYKVKWDSARVLLATVAANRPYFRGLETGLSTQTFRQLKRSANKTEDIGELCVRCKDEAADLSHIVFRCPHWHKERREVELPEDDVNTPPCVKLHGLLPAPRLPAIRTHEPALANRVGVVTVWTDGSGRHSSDPHHRRCGVGYYTDTQERVFFPLPRIKQSVYRAELHAVARALEECQPHEVVSDCKGVVKAVQALQTGRMQPKGRNRDLEQRVQNALLPGQRIQSRHK
eukprot:369411-Amphidinium_carterae.1